MKLEIYRAVNWQDVFDSPSGKLISGEVERLLREYRQNQELVRNIGAHYYQIIYPVQLRHHEKMGISTREVGVSKVNCTDHARSSAGVHLSRCLWESGAPRRIRETGSIPGNTDAFHLIPCLRYPRGRSSFAETLARLHGRSCPLLIRSFLRRLQFPQRGYSESGYPNSRGRTKVSVIDVRRASLRPRWPNSLVPRRVELSVFP